MLQVSCLTKIYHGVTVLNIPHLIVKQGETLGIVGNNGAGKTTFCRLVLDLIQSDSGEVRIRGERVASNEDWKSFTGSFLDTGFLIDFLTPREYLQFVAGLHHKTKDELNQFTEDMAEFLGFEIRESKKLIRDYSKGNQKKIGIVAALIGDPQFLVLDEPFTALDPSSQIRLKRFLSDIQKQFQTTMLISSHELIHVTEVCNRIVVLEKGLLVKDIRTNEDTLSELQEYFTV